MPATNGNRAIRVVLALAGLLLAAAAAGQTPVVDDTHPKSTDKQAATVDASDAAQPAVPTSTEQGQTLMDDSFEVPHGEASVQEQRRQAFRDTDFYAQLRSYYFNSRNLNDTSNEAWALGGSGGFKTGYFRDFFAVGATAYTSQRLEGPLDKDGTKLLAPGQEGYSVIGEAYTELLLGDGIRGSIGLRGYDTPFIGRFDSRMTPNTFEAAVIQGAVGSLNGDAEWRFGAGYVDKIKERDSASFVSMAAAAGAPPGVSRGVSVVGATYKSGDLSIGGVEYYSADIINIAYLEAKDAIALGDRLRLQVAAQYTNQQSVGRDLLTGNAFSAYQFGFKTELAFAGLLLTGAYTVTGDGNGITMQSPWSKYPGYSAVQVDDFNRAGENAWLVRVGYNLPKPNLTAYVLFVHGSRPSEAKQYAQDECDLSLQWQAPGKLRGLKLLARYGLVTQSGPDPLHTNQLRLVLYYTPL